MDPHGFPLLAGTHGEYVGSLGRYIYLKDALVLLKGKPSGSDSSPMAEISAYQ
jgi:hypothetical protein